MKNKSEGAEKKEITKVMLLSLAYHVKKNTVVPRRTELGEDIMAVKDEKVEEYFNYVLPLDNFDMIEEDKCNRLILKVKDIKLPRKKLIRATLSLSNDARMTWASDWSDLGCFRLVYKLFDPKLKLEGNKLIIEASRRDRDLTIPDRTRWM
jgi:hypothetical protein